MTVDEIEHELSLLPSWDRFHLFHVLSRGADQPDERERHVAAPPLHIALTALRATMAGLTLDAQSLLVEALNYDINQAWLEEIRHQIEGFDEEEMETIDAETFLAELRQRRDAERAIEDEVPDDCEPVPASDRPAPAAAPVRAAERRPRGRKRARRSRRGARRP